MSDLRTEATPQAIVRELEAVLGRRVDALERENQRLKRYGTLTTALVGGMLLLNAAMLGAMRAREGRVADVVEARRFVLRDADGHVRSVLAVGNDGAARLVLQDRDGRERLKMALLADGSPGMSFADREGRSRAVLGLLADETSTLVFADRSGKTRAVLGLSPDESSTLVFADRNGETRVGLGVEADGSSGLTVFEKEPAHAAPAATPDDSTAAAGTR